MNLKHPTIYRSLFAWMIVIGVSGLTAQAQEVKPAYMPSMNQPAPTNGIPTQMQGMILPPGMIMTPDMTRDQMQDMAAMNPTQATFIAPKDAQGDQVLKPEIINGVKVFNLTTSIIKWNILPNVQVTAYAF